MADISNSAKRIEARKRAIEILKPYRGEPEQARVNVAGVIAYAVAAALRELNKNNTGEALRELSWAIYELSSGCGRRANISGCGHAEHRLAVEAITVVSAAAPDVSLRWSRDALTDILICQRRLSEAVEFERMPPDLLGFMASNPELIGGLLSHALTVDGALPPEVAQRLRSACHVAPISKQKTRLMAQLLERRAKTTRSAARRAKPLLGCSIRRKRKVFNA